MSENRMIQERLKALENKLDKCRSFERIATAEVDRTTTQVSRFYATLGWRERHLGGWFFGDRARVKEFRDLLRRAEELAARKSRATRASLRAEAACVQVVTEYLLDSDQDFSRLHAERQAVTRAVRFGVRLLRKIDAALAEVKDAEWIETMDFTSDDKGIAMLSHVETEEARRAIERTRQATMSFQTTLTRYDDFIKRTGSTVELTAVSDPSDTLDLICDFIGTGGFDFTSLLTLSRLNEAESDLCELQAQVTKVHTVLAGRQAILEKKYRDRVATAQAELIRHTDATHP